jgi:hypothetical protein
LADQEAKSPINWFVTVYCPGLGLVPPKALNTLSRLPETVLPARDARGSPVFIKAFFTCWAVQVGFCDHNKAAAPATWGLAMDVPDLIP